MTVASMPEVRELDEALAEVNRREVMHVCVSVLPGGVGRDEAFTMGYSADGDGLLSSAPMAPQRAIKHREGNLQLMACAGSGKVEAPANRVARRLEPTATPPSLPRNIAAFTESGQRSDATTTLEGDKLKRDVDTSRHVQCLSILREADEPAASVIGRRGSDRRHPRGRRSRCAVRAARVACGVRSAIT